MNIESLKNKLALLDIPKIYSMNSFKLFSS